MACAANYAWANRQMIMHLVEEALLHALSMGPKDLGLRLVYDVAHNIAKIEEHTHDGGHEWLCVHRKGATRAFAPGHPELPAAYREVGQPVLIPGDMGTASFVCKGTQAAMDQTFGSTCHGAGRVLSRRRRDQALAGAIDRARTGGRGCDRALPGKEDPAGGDSRGLQGCGRGGARHGRGGYLPRVARLRPLGVVKG